MSDIQSSSRISPTGDALRTQKMQALKALGELRMRQVDTKREMQEWAEEAFNPVAMMRRFRSLEEQKVRKKEKSVYESDQKEKIVEEAEKAESAANDFQRNNQELQAKTLLILRGKISPGDTPEEILRKVLEVYSDYSLADEALEFLAKTFRGETQIAVEQAKELLHAYYGREVRAGKNIQEEAIAFSKELGSATSLRDIYRDITGTPREPNQLFQELSSKFSYDKMKTVIDFLLRSLGADLKAKGPSISRAELKSLLDDTRTLQAILGVYRFFASRMKMIHKQFNSLELPFPSLLGFEELAKQFMKLLEEKYPSTDKVKQLARFLGISEQLAAQIIIFTQMRDAVRQVAPKLYRSNKHKQDTLLALIEALEDLEDLLEEEEES